MSFNLALSCWRQVAKEELALECDYEYEAQCQVGFRVSPHISRFFGYIGAGLAAASGRPLSDIYIWFQPAASAYPGQ